MCKVFRYIFHKKFRALPCLYAEDHTNQEYRAVFDIDSSDDWILLGNYFLDVTVSFFQKYSPTERGLPKQAVQGSHRNTYLPSYTVCSGSTLNMIGLYNRNGTPYSLTKEWISSHSLLYLRKTNMRGSYMQLMYSEYTVNLEILATKI